MPGPDQIEKQKAEMLKNMMARPGFQNSFFGRLLSQAEACENKNPFMPCGPNKTDKA
jgi:hypothetical protein